MEETKEPWRLNDRMRAHYTEWLSVRGLGEDDINVAISSIERERMDSYCFGDKDGYARAKRECSADDNEACLEALREFRDLRKHIRNSNKGAVDKIQNSLRG